MPVLTAGKLSPKRDVPAHIVRPPYVGKRSPDRYKGSEIQS